MICNLGLSLAWRRHATVLKPHEYFEFLNIQQILSKK